MENNLKILDEIPEEQDIQKESESYPLQAKDLALAIKDDRSYKLAADFLLAIKGFRKRVEDEFGPVVKKANEAWKAAIELRKRADAPLDEAERIIKPSMAQYVEEQERKRRAEEDRIRAEQRKKDEEAKLQAAIEAEKNGDKETSKTILDAPPAPVIPVNLPKTEKVNGISFRENWKFRITNPLLIPRDYLLPDEKKIGQMVRALKSETKIPGFEVYCEKEVAARSK